VVEPGESVAFVGEFGSGKSTIASLLLRFYDPDFGEILLDGQNIQAYDLHELRQQLSLVHQEPLLFNNNILENILYGKLNAQNSEIQQAAATANCEDFLSAGRLF
jgi:ABC-type multidrug transport system fused ATPase/permease subunit